MDYMDLDGLVASSSSFADLKMPYDAKAESAVLSAIACDPSPRSSRAVEAMAQVGEDDFYIEKNRVIFRAVEALLADGKASDGSAILAYLKDAGLLEAAGGLSRLSDVLLDPMGAIGWRDAAARVHELACRRRFMSTLWMCLQQTSDLRFTNEELSQQSSSQIMGCLHDLMPSSKQTWGQAVDSAADDIREGNDHMGLFRGLSSGLDSIDRFTCGFRGGQLIVIGARPGVGKTSFALSMALSAARQGWHPVFVSLEMSQEELAKKQLEHDLRVSDRQTMSGGLDLLDPVTGVTYAAGLGAVQADLRVQPMTVNDASDITLASVESLVRRVYEEAGTKTVLYLDYIQLLDAGPGHPDNRSVEIGRISRRLKQLALELDIPIFVMSQLNRQVTGRVGRKPQLSDLRESGAIEQDANIVLLLDRSTTPEEAEEMERPNADEMLVYVAKNRSGATGEVCLRCVSDYMGLADMDSSGRAI